MATKVVWSNPVVYMNGVDMSASLQAFKITRNWEEVDGTAINDTGKRRQTGLQDNSADGTFMSNWAAAGVNQTIAPLAGGTIAISAWPNGSTTGTTNPKYTGNFLIKEWAPMDTTPGALATAQFSWPCDGTVNEAYS